MANSRLAPAPAAAVARVLLRPVQAFVETEASGGIVLVAAAIVALVWANSPFANSYEDLWQARVALHFNVVTIDEDLRHLVNDGAMTLFFFVAGLEIKRELLFGELAGRRRAILPAAAALGGMAVPAAIYAAWNAGGAGAHGWGIPMATDIAFALGVLALAGPRVPFALKVFLLALAIVDDLVAILVIAVFYTDHLAVAPLAWAAVIIAAVLVARAVQVRSLIFYVVPGVLLWLAVFKSGIHATVAGVVLAMLTPASARVSREAYEPAVEALLDRYHAAGASGDRDAQESILAEVGRLTAERTAPLDRLERALHPWASFLVVPLFALANAGLDLSGSFFADAARSPVAAGVATGLVAGKLAGILAASWLMVRAGLAELPPRVTWAQMAGVALLGGVGFTVSLFVTALAFEDPGLAANAKAGIFAASILAGISGLVVLRLTGRAARLD